MSGVRPIVFGVLAAVSAGAWVIFHSMRRMSAAAVVGYAALYVLIAAAACILAFAVTHPPRRVCVRHHFVCAITMACFVPAFMLFADRGSPWLIVPMAAVASAAAFAFSAHHDAAIDFVPGTAGVLSGPLPAWSIRREAVWASVMLQSGVVLAAAGEALWSAPLIAVGSFALAAGAFPLAPRSGLSCQNAARCARRLGVSAAAAVLLTMLALEPHLARTSAQFTGDGDTDTPPVVAPPAGSDASADQDDVYQGVIILPEVEQQITLVPPMPSMRAASTPSRPMLPFSMPFFGAYWVYRPPHRQPPPGSLVLRGKPVDRKLRSTDRVHLKMEARQNFGSYIDLACCSRIDVAVTSRDTFFGTVALELIARDSATGDQQSMGIQSVPSSPGRLWDLPLATQTLSYSVARPQRFDEAVFVFHLAAMRADMAARVAIERFIFVPK